MRTIAGTAAGRVRGIEIIGWHGIPYAAPAGRPTAAADAAGGEATYGNRTGQNDQLCPDR